MPIINHILKMLVTITTCLVLVGCATTQHLGSGTILSAKKLDVQNVKSHEATKKGAKVGGVTGAIIGATAGGLLGLALSSSAILYQSTSAVIVATIAGGVIGAIIVGGAGVATGAGVGYVVDSTSPPSTSAYEFVVQPDFGGKPLVVTQHSSLIPVNARVKIKEKSNVIFIQQ